MTDIQLLYRADYGLVQPDGTVETFLDGIPCLVYRASYGPRPLSDVAFASNPFQYMVFAKWSDCEEIIRLGTRPILGVISPAGIFNNRNVLIGHSRPRNWPFPFRAMFIKLPVRVRATNLGLIQVAQTATQLVVVPS